MSVLAVRGLSMGFGERELFSGTNFDIERTDKVGFIGRNGTGKTTLFHILNGSLSPTDGEVIIEHGARIGYMEQHACENSDRNIYDELLTVFDPLIRLESEICSITERIDRADGDLDALVSRQTAMIEQFERDGGLTFRSRARAALLGLGFSEKDFSLPVHALSGGQRSKLSLSKLLLSDCTLMLLDEPTNHLDISSVSWLEGFLRDFRGAIILISHDRYFLDAVTTKTIELEHKRITMYKGGYTEFMKKKAALAEAVRNKYENDMREIHRIEGIVEQQRRWNRERNIRTAESKLKEIERIRAQLVVPDGELEEMRMTFSPRYESGNDVLIAENLSKSFDDKRLFTDVSFTLRRGERVFILGDNGCGKTTLFRILTRRYPADTGAFTLGAGVEIGYFDQMQENLDLNNTAIDEIRNTYPALTETHIRSSLAAFLFKGDEVYKKLSAMSGGERARISLLKLMLGGGNFLLLDEPTNHLDASSREQLEDTLLNYSGTLLIISHDRYFVNKLADRVLVLKPDGVHEYLGNYDNYIERISAQPVAAEEKTPDAPPAKKPLNDYQLRKQQASEERRRQTRLKRAEEAIAALEEQIEETQKKLQSEEVISDYEQLLSLTEKLEALHRDLDEQYEIWSENAE